MRSHFSKPIAQPNRSILGALLAGALVLRLGAQSDQLIYSDSLLTGWNDWSWSSTTDFNFTANTHSGSKAITVTFSDAWAAFSLEHSAFSTTPYTNLTFWINGGSAGGQQLQVAALLGTNVQNTINLPTLSPNTWQQISLSLTSLGVANKPNLARFWIQDRAGAVQAPFYLDDITLLSTNSGSPPVTNLAITISVDANANRHPISPLIYGVAFASSNQLSDLNFTLNRSGGNSETRNNWQLNAHNHANDWYYQSLDDFNSGDSRATVSGANADQFVSDTRAGGGQPLLTIPMLGWMPKLGPSRGKLASYSIAKYGPQTGNDAQYMPDAGNGIGTNAASHTSWLIVTNDPTDANFLTNSGYQRAWVQHLTNRWGLSTNGGVNYYIMDNEHSIWFSTHRDVHPVGPTMAEIRDKFFDYAGMVKSLDPSAMVLFPEEFGWSGYLYSGYDLQWGGQHGWNGPLPDRTANGGMDYMPWLLSQLYQRATNTHQRLLDYFTLHCYPEDGNVSGNDVSDATRLLRNRLTRKFWDPTYVDETWINTQVQLIPRMKGWVASYYPGTKTGITEYNWGAEGNINGATAQADILGIFGREGLDLATRWTTPASSTPTYKAMKMFRNYDGNKSGFGDTSISAAAPNPDDVATFAATRSSDGALTLMVLNKQLTTSATPSVSLSNFLPGGPAQVWQLTSANSIARLSDIALSGNAFSNTVPAQSITLYVVPALKAGLASNPNPTNGTLNVPLNTTLTWKSGSNAVSHRVFLGLSSSAVATATTNSPEYKATLSVTNYAPSGLVLGQAYYWRVDEVAGTYANTGAVWSFTTPLLAGLASNPTPPNGATNVNLNTSLGWTTGASATAHRLFFGANSNGVANATPATPEFIGDLSSPSYTPGTALASSGRFFWRVDELAGPNATTGPVWTFATAVVPANSFPVSGVLSSSTFILGFVSQVGQTYRVERTDNLIPQIWSSLTNGLAGTGGFLQINDPDALLPGQRFYRVVILPP